MLVSCGTVKVNNQEWCGDFGQFGGECFHTQSEGKRTIEQPAWDEYRFGMVCAKPMVFADMKRTILQLCKAYKKCVYDTNENTISFYNGSKAKTVTVIRLFDHIENFTMEVKKLNR